VTGFLLARQLLTFLAAGGQCWWAKQIGVIAERKIWSPVSSWSLSWKQGETATADKVREQLTALIHFVACVFSC